MTITTLTPDVAKRAVAAGAILVDIRNDDEHARERIPGAINIPLARIEDVSATTGPIIYHCRSGMRTEANASVLAAAAQDRPCQILEGGLDAWRAAGHQTSIDRKQPIEVIRQVQLIAGALVLLGAILAATVSPAFVALSGFVGAGLMVAGATGWCGMARLLRLMPWNRRSPVA